MTLHTAEINKRYYPVLLQSEIVAIAGVDHAEVTMDALKPRQRLSSGLAEVITDDYAMVLPLVEAVISNHVPDPGPGPVGLTVGDLDEAWEVVGRQVAAGTASLDLFRQDAAAFHTDLEAALTGGVSQEEINRRLAWMLYSTQRFLGMPRPASYDPFNEATVVMADDGTLTWTATGPPW